MGYFDDVYLKRLNKYGTTYSDRVQGRREFEFQHQLEKKSAYYVEFVYNHKKREAELVPQQQFMDETISHLLTPVQLDMPAGTVITVKDKLNVESKWLIYWKKDAIARGYNRYTVIKMTSEVEIGDEKIPCRFYGPEQKSIRDVIKAETTQYLEDTNGYFMLCPANAVIEKDIVIEVKDKVKEQAFRIVGYDIQSVPGVEFTTLDPIYFKDKTPAPQKPEGDTSDDYYWLEGK